MGGRGGGGRVTEEERLWGWTRRIGRFVRSRGSYERLKKIKQGMTCGFF